MQETEQLISLYHTAFIVFLILTIVFALISVLIFFQFRIKDVFDFKTGRGQKRTIRQMEEELGRPLLVRGARGSRGVKLTEEGRIVCQRVEPRP